MTTLRELPQGMSMDKTNADLMACEACGYIWRELDGDRVGAVDMAVNVCPCCTRCTGEPLYAPEGGADWWLKR